MKIIALSNPRSGTNYILECLAQKHSTLYLGEFLHENLQPESVVYNESSKIITNYSNIKKETDLADSYIKLGFLSSIIYVFALKLLISFADHNFDIKNQFLIFSIIFVPFFSLANSALTTSLFSHGLLLSLILVSQSSFNETRKKT